ncbi:hypothetical protein OF83DRAFT_1089225, partial [Amylostereum chailletii]
MNPPTSFDTLFTRERAPYHLVVSPSGSASTFDNGAAQAPVNGISPNQDTLTQPSPNLPFNFNSVQVTTPATTSHLSIIALATPEQLQASGNTVYLQVIATIHRLEQEKAVLIGEKTVLQNAFNTVIASIGGSNNPAAAAGPAAGLVPFVILRHEDHLNVKFWNRSDYVKHANSLKGISTPHVRGSKAISAGVNTTATFLDDENGHTINGHYVSSIRSALRDVFHVLQLNNRAPKTWKRASPRDRDHIYAELERQYPILRLCENHWKIEWLVIHTYPQWYRNHVLQVQDSDEDSDDDVFFVGSAPNDDDDDTHGAIT